MANRISFSQMSTQIMDRLFANYGKLEGIQTQLSTGKRINKASDNPIGTSQSMDLRSEVDQYTNFSRNIVDGLAYLGTVDSTLSTGNNLYQNLRERAIQAASDSNSAESRNFIGKESRAIFDQMVALANTSFKNEYIFAGTNSQVPPYEVRTGTSKIEPAPGALSGNMTLTAGLLGTPLQIVDKNVDDSKDTVTFDANAYQLIPGTVKVNGLTEGVDFTLDYIKGTITFTAPGVNVLAMAGGVGGIDMSYNWLRRNEKNLDGVSNREIEEGVSARINSTATDVFGSTQEVNAWEGMINLLEGTLNNKPAKIVESIDKIDLALKRQLGAQSTTGSRVQRLESTQDRNQNRIVYTTQLQSETEDVDFAQAISDYNLQSTVYEASLKMGARAMQNTLMNFI